MSGAMYREIFDKVNDGIVIHDPETGEILDVNERTTELFGFSKEELRAGDVADFSAVEAGFDQERAIREIRRAREQGEHRFEWLHERRDGTRFWAQVNLRKATVQGDEKVLAIVRDISEQKEHAQKRAAAEKRFRALAENASFVVVTVDESSTIQYVNEAVADLFGYPPETLIGRSLTTIIPDALEGAHTAGFERYQRTGERKLDWDGIELPGEHRDGHEIDLEVSFGELEIGDERLFTGIIQDISQRVARQRAIESLHDVTRRMLRADDATEIGELAVQASNSILEYPTCGLWLTDEADQQLRPVAWSDEADSFYNDVPTIDADADSLAWTAFETGDPVLYDDVREAEAVYNPETSVRSEMVVPVGRRGILIFSSDLPADFSETDLSLVGLLGANVEVGLERVEQVQSLTRQRNHLEFLNSLLGHDVKNGMMVIDGYADLLEEGLGDDAEGRAHVDTIQEWSDDIIELIDRIQRMLDVSTGQRSPQLEARRLRPLVDAEVRRFDSAHPAVDVTVDVGDDVSVRADEFLPEVLGNVLSNAAVHNETADLHVEVTAVESTDGTQLRIADTGSGVPDEAKAAIFNRGRSSETSGTGAGFGLFFAETMMRGYGGRIWVEENDPTGAVFVLEFPTGTDPSTASGQ